MFSASEATKLGRGLLLLLLTTRWYHMVASYGKVEFPAGKARAPSKRWAGRPLHPTPILLQNTLNTNPDAPMQDLLSSSTQRARLWPRWWSL